MWVATEQGLAAYDALLALVALIDQNDKKKGLRDIAFDPFLDQLRVATEKELRRYDVNGTTTLIRSVREIEHIAVDGRGGIWIADEHTVSLIDTSGRMESTVRPMSGKKEVHIVDLVSDPSDRTAWVAGKKSLSQISPEGTLLREVDLRAAKVINLETAVERRVECDPLGAGQGARRRNSKLFRRVATPPYAHRGVLRAS